MKDSLISIIRFRRFHPFLFRCSLLLTLIASGLFASVTAAQVSPPSRPTAILPIDQVRIGMKGYGLTVFAGDKVEPFPVQVVSVMSDFTPGKGVIWIRSSDPRLQQSGPVHGMSGSPIYLWTDDQPQQLGVGGKLIGAFAFGFQATKDCYAGVQSIQAMREIGQRAREQTRFKEARNAPSGDPSQQLRQLLAQFDQQSTDHAASWRGRTILKLLENPRSVSASKARLEHLDSLAGIPRVDTAGPLGISGTAKPLLLPLNMRSAELVSLTSPLLESMGMAPMQSPAGTLIGKPPKEINPDKLNLAPGSVLAIPLIWGDLDLSASGTVTEVLPDGRVLAFGHAMFGQGPASLPMAGGYVHYVVPSIISSFKLAGAGVMRGALVRDEKSGVVGMPNSEYESAQVNVAVHRHDAPVRTYQYKIARHKNLTPLLASIAAVESALSESGFPLDNTVRLQVAMQFDGGRKLQMDSLIPMASDRALLIELTPPMIALAQNEFQTTLLTRMDVRIDVQPVALTASLISVRPDRTQMAPGETVNLTLSLQTRGQSPTLHRIAFATPADLPEGDYTLVLCDGRTYLNLYMQSHPHLTYLTNVDDVVKMLDTVLSVRRDALYLVLQRPEQGLAVGRQNLPQLPSSRRAMMSAPTALPVTNYSPIVSQIIPLEQVCDGQGEISLSVRNQYDRRK